MATGARKMAGRLQVGQPPDVDGHDGVSVVLRRGGDRREHLARVERGCRVGSAAGISLMQRDCGR